MKTYKVTTQEDSKDIVADRMAVEDPGTGRLYYTFWKDREQVAVYNGNFIISIVLEEATEEVLTFTTHK